MVYTKNNVSSQPALWPYKPFLQLSNAVENGELVPALQEVDHVFGAIAAVGGNRLGVTGVNKCQVLEDDAAANWGVFNHKWLVLKSLLTARQGHAWVPTKIIWQGTLLFFSMREHHSTYSHQQNNRLERWQRPNQPAFQNSKNSVFSSFFPFIMGAQSKWSKIPWETESNLSFRCDHAPNFSKLLSGNACQKTNYADWFQWTSDNRMAILTCMEHMAVSHFEALLYSSCTTGLCP